MKKASKHTKYIGIDESNHGRFPEVFVAVISSYECDALNTQCWKKLRKNIKRFPHGKYRDYTFLLAGKGDEDRIGKQKFIGKVIGSLIIEDIDPVKTNNLEIYLDGDHWTKSQEIYVRDYLSEIIEISKRNIKLNTGSALDEKLYLVHLADQRASTIKRWSLDKASKSKRQRELLE